MKTDKQKSKEILSNFYNHKCLFADTETTGFSKTSEIIEISIVDHEGNTVMDTLIKPKGSIPKEVTAIHGIDSEMVKSSPTWEEIHNQFMKVTEGKILVFYNRSFDLRMLKQTAGQYDLCDVSFETTVEDSTVCAMKPYAMYNGEPLKSGRGYKSVKLTTAAEQEGVDMSDQVGGAHRALFDSLMVQRMCKNIGSDDTPTTGEVTSF